MWNYFQGKTFWLYYRPVSEKFDLYDLCFGEHKFAICEDVCVSHLHSILHFSRTDIADTFRWCCWILNVQTDAFTEFSEWNILTSSGSPRLKNIYRHNIWIFGEIAKFFISDYYDKVYIRRWRFFPWILARVLKIFLAYPPPSPLKHSLVCCYVCFCDIPARATKIRSRKYACEGVSGFAAKRFARAPTPASYAG